MTISEMLSQSGLLTLLGMCVVFAFLIIMILGMNLLHAAIHALKLDKDAKPEVKTQSAKPASSVVSSTVKTDNNAVIAAIAAAVYEKESI